MATATTRPCPRCGHAMPEQAKFCGQCGAMSEAGPTTEPAPPPADKPDATALGLSKTIVEFHAPPAARVPPLAATLASAASPLAAASPASPPAPAPAPAPTFQGGKATMIGISAADLYPAAPQPTPAPAPAPAPRLAAQTMLGVARPGIAPTQSGGDAPAPAAAAPMSLGSAKQTMIGVARPGIAPVDPRGAPAPAPAAVSRRAPAPPPVEIVPAPPPLVHDEAAPAAPVIAVKRGVPLGLVALLVGAIVVLGGGLLALLFWRGAPAITGSAGVAANGDDEVHLHCDSCDDGTRVTIDKSSTTFQRHDATLLLSAPLHVGKNPLALHVDRPGSGRDETVTLDVEVDFRVFPDLSTIDTPTPAITVRVEAAPGSTATVDDKPVALDGSGKGAYVIDLGAQTTGAGDEVRVHKDVAYTVTPKGEAPRKGTVTADVTVLPLSVDRPGTSAVVEAVSVLVVGRIYKSAQVTVNGIAVTPSADGVFSQTVAAPAIGDVPIEVRTSAQSYAPRVARFSVKRVDSLAAWSKTLDAAPPPGFDAIAPQSTKHVGEPFVVEGEVADTSVEGKVQRSVLVVDDRRGCAKGPCLVRVRLARADPGAKRGDVVRVYGHVAPPFVTKDGASALTVDGDYVTAGKK